VGACPAGEVFIPAPPETGFTVGRADGGPADTPHPVHLSHPFCMDSTEVTVRAYRACVEAGQCELPRLGDLNSNYRYGEERATHPVNMVSWDQAQAYCASQGKALPTEAQWIWAAGHGDGRVYPWGDTAPTCAEAIADFTPGGTPKTDPAGNFGCRGGGTSPVGTHPLGKSEWASGALQDLGGNVWEWTRDCFVPYSNAPERDPHHTTHPHVPGTCFVRSMLGGAWNRSGEAMKIGWRAASRHTYQVPGLGFRCVREAAP
jgi:formylglycine-generating enzyme required for sulfatase activity